MKNIRELGDISGKRVFLRADLNVPIANGVVADDFRIKRMLPTLDFLLGKGAEVVLASHTDSASGTLMPVYEYLKEKANIFFIENYFPEKPEFLQDKKPGRVIFLENLRKYDGEKDNDESFSRQLASFADIYVNEAFSVSHRAHASIIGIPNFIPGFAGFVLVDEVENLSKAFAPEHPFLFILGGAKFDTKLPLVKKFFTLADKIFIGGALANDFFKARGWDTGKSLLSENQFSLGEFFNEKLVLPEDVLVRSGGQTFLKKPEELGDEDIAVDIGPVTEGILHSLIDASRFVLWNGPLGNYELGFKEGTLKVADAIAKSKTLSIVGGGDTIASIAELKNQDKFSFVSTGGGAMLDFLANETLPGLEALG